MGTAMYKARRASSVVYQFIRGRLSKPQVMDFSEIENAEGAIMEIEGRKLAVYRDETGKLHAMSPVCRHLKCIVDWNPHEQTWDCPCHGSRYDPMGHVIEGPAGSNLLHEDLS